MTQIIAMPFGTTTEGKEITRYILVSGSGMQVSVLSYGCTVQSILVPDRDGTLRDIALGYNNIEGYEKGSSYFGAFIGRYANRIRHARFFLNGRLYCLENNEGNNHLHGSFAHRIFDGVIRDDAVVFPFVSLPSEEGYPGTLRGEVLYRLTEDNALEIEYTATSDEDTVVNLTNHTYFNLNGRDGSDILNHTLKINSDSFTEINEEHLVTGRILDVDGTPFDFQREKEIGAEIFCDDRQLRLASGYDHNLILHGSAGELRETAVVKSRESGIVMTMATTEPCVQLYTGNLIHEDAAPCGKSGAQYPRFGGFCLEAQRFPDSMNQPAFPTAVLRKGKKYFQKTVYRFSAL